MFYFMDMEKEFLHKINLPMLQKELNMDLQGIANLVDVSAQTVYRWSWDKSKQGNRPTYNAIKILLEHGATLETLFGIKDLPSKATSAPAGMTREEFIAGVKEALAALGKG